LATIHANAPDQVFLRLVQMATMHTADGIQMSRNTILQSAASALHLLVHVQRKDGVRQVGSIAAVEPLDGQGEPRSVALFERRGDNLVATGTRPRWIGQDGRLLV